MYTIYTDLMSKDKKDSPIRVKAYKKLSKNDKNAH